MSPRHIRIPFMDPLVRAIAADEKTVTRRLIPGIPSDADEVFHWEPSQDIAHNATLDGVIHDGYPTPRVANV